MFFARCSLPVALTAIGGEPADASMSTWTWYGGGYSGANDTANHSVPSHALTGMPSTGTGRLNCS